MLSAEKLKHRTAKSWNVTHVSKNVPSAKSKMQNPFGVFVGNDGKPYKISYPEELIRFTNCYSFAMGWRMRGIKGSDYNPGFLTVREIPTKENLLELVKSDLAVAGRKIFDILTEVPETLPKEKEGYWIKAMYCAERGDDSIHFMMKDPNSGCWIHKMGWHSAPKVVTDIIKTQTFKEAVMSSKSFEIYDRETIELVMDSFGFNSSIAGKITPKEVDVARKDNIPYKSIGEDDRIYVYDTLWVMRISEP